MAGIFLLLAEISSHERTLLDADRDLDNMSLNLSRQFQDRFEACDLIVQAASQEPWPETSAELERFDRRLRDLSRMLPGAPAVRFADAGGSVRYTDGANGEARLQISDRAFFGAARARPGETVISLPLTSRITGRWIVPVARQILDRQGRFAGVVFVDLPLADVDRALDGLQLGQDGVALLAGENGDLFARTSNVLMPRAEERALGKVSQATRAALARGEAARRYESIANVDGVLRLTMFRKVGAYPLYVVVGLKKSEVFAGWWREVIAAALGWLALLAGALWFVLFQRQARDTLVHALRLLGEARQTADRANEFKSSFLASMSHEIRTPMNAVIGFAQLGQRLSAGSPETCLAFSRIINAGTHLQGILNDILDITQIEAGRLDLRPQPVEVRKVAERAADMVRESASAKGVEFKLEAAPGLSRWLMVDPLRLEQILLNLLSNAVKFTERGRVELSLLDVGDTIRIRVTDTGIGMTPESLEKIFVPFVQGDRTVTRRFGGSGLGLVITKRLVEMMNGAITVESRFGHGSQFTVGLPRIEPRPEEMAALQAEDRRSPTMAEDLQEAERKGRLSGLRILVAEDNEVNRLVIEGMLRLEGARVEMADDGYQAVERFKAAGPSAFDAVLVDIMMPGIDGYETARRILEIQPSAVVIGQTASALADDGVRCQAVGMVGRILKPIRLDDMVQLILKSLQMPRVPLERPH